jgi:hypothetical protein
MRVEIFIIHDYRLNRSGAHWEYQLEDVGGSDGLFQGGAWFRENALRVAKG